MPVSECHFLKFQLLLPKMLTVAPGFCPVCMKLEFGSQKASSGGPQSRNGAGGRVWSTSAWSRVSMLKTKTSCSLLSDSLWPQGVYSPWDSPGQNTGVGSLSLLQQIFPIQGSNPGLPHCRWILYQLNHQGSKGLQGAGLLTFSREKSTFYHFCPSLLSRGK